MRSIKEIKKQYFEDREENRKRQLVENAEIIEDFISFCEKKNILLTKNSFSYIETIGLIAKHPDLLNKINPSLVKDDEQLVSCKLLEKFYTKNPIDSGLLFSQNYIAMAHPFFRRGLNEYANFAPRFIDLFWKIKNDKIDFFVTLDPDRVRIDIDGGSYMEFDTWYGASFNQKVQDIPNGTVKLRPPLDLEEFDISLFFKDVYSLDIKWSEKNGIKTFQAEEFKTDNYTILVDGEKFHPVRYIHAEFDINKKHFRHFDGAIHLYEENEYHLRRKSDFNFNEKIDKHLKARTFKVFKMNGVVDVDTWITYTSHFFTGNPLIFEYFEGKYPEHITNFLNTVRK